MRPLSIDNSNFEGDQPLSPSCANCPNCIARNEPQNNEAHRTTRRQPQHQHNCGNNNSENIRNQVQFKSRGKLLCRFPVILLQLYGVYFTLYWSPFMVFISFFIFISLLGSTVRPHDLQHSYPRERDGRGRTHAPQKPVSAGQLRHPAWICPLQQQQ